MQPVERRQRRPGPRSHFVETHNETRHEKWGQSDVALKDAQEEVQMESQRGVDEPSKVVKDPETVA